MINKDGQYTKENVRQLTEDELISEARKYLITCDYKGKDQKSALLERIIETWVMRKRCNYEHENN